MWTAFLKAFSSLEALNSQHMATATTLEGRPGTAWPGQRLSNTLTETLPHIPLGM